ncbi:MAG: hypothetical protein R2746_14210 [Acidimicrobiales bacterium]
MAAPAALGVLALALGHPARAIPLLVAATVVAVLVAAGVDVAGWIARGALAAGRGLSLVLSWILFVVVILPASAWSALRRRGIRGRRSQPTAWSEHRPTEVRIGALGSTTPGIEGRRGLVGRVTWAIGCVVLVLGANYGLGWIWDRATVDGSAGGIDLALSPTIERDPRIDVPAMAAYPWRGRYFADIQRAPISYWPYTEFRPDPFRSPYVNVDGWTRRSYRTPGTRDGRPVVWMFGGSTAWGEGQRDEYTIASYLARLAEADGVPIEVANFGQRSWTHFQEMVLYEQRLALEGPPDLSLFYDGVNDLNVQSLITEAVPANYQVADPAAGTSIATRFAQEPSTSTVLEDVWHEYSKHSLVHKLLRRIDQPAGASPLAPAAPAAPTALAGPSPGSFDITPQDGTDAGKVYERIKRLTLSLSERYDVETLLYWQPVQYLGTAHERAEAELTAPTIDISELLLDHQDVFLDGAHTNEEGARLVAERIWDDLGPAVQEWYRRNG